MPSVKPSGRAARPPEPNRVLRGGAPSGDDEPLTDLEAATLFSPFAQAKHVLVAVSGGPDSVCLAGLVAEWRESRPSQGDRPQVTAVTFDHGLRSASRGEAEGVAAFCRSLAIPHRILNWASPVQGAGLQEAAREARYEAFARLADEIEASHLLTAHTLDDQAETMLLRLARGSSMTGLIGMRSETKRGNLIHRRPFLGVTKLRLIATCRARGWPYVEDPSNADVRFTRARLRKLMPQLAEEGLTAQRFAVLSARLERAEAALDHCASQALERARLDNGQDSVYFNGAYLLELPVETVSRALNMAVRMVTRIDDQEAKLRHLRLQRLEALTEALVAAAREKRILRRTFGGCRFMLSAKGLLQIGPESTRRRGIGRRS